MNQDINLVIEQFKQTLINICQESNLPIGIIYYVMKDFYTGLESDYYNYLNRVSRELQQPAEEEIQAQENIPAPEESTPIDGEIED